MLSYLLFEISGVLCARYKVVVDVELAGVVASLRRRREPVGDEVDLVAVLEALQQLVGEQLQARRLAKNAGAGDAPS